MTIIKGAEAMSKVKITAFQLLAVAIIGGLMFILGCSSKDYGTNNGGGNGGHSLLITISNFAFTPTPDTVAVGDTVTWRNDQTVGHTVTSDQGSELASAVFSQGQTYQHVFTATGSYAYHCTPHPNMHGIVVVH